MTTSPSSDESVRAQSPEFTNLALDAACVGEFDWDIALDQVFVSARLAAITGLPGGLAPADGGNLFLDQVRAEDRETAKSAMGRAFCDRDKHDAEFRWVRPDNGREIQVKLQTLIVDREGTVPRRTIGVIGDITDQSSAIEQSDALVAELDHRIKNVLSAVQSLAAQSARRTVSLESFLKTFFGRLEAMAAAHTLLTATRWRGAEINQIAAAELGGLAQGQARWEGPEIVLNPRATHALTLALHELGANAVRHGALSSETGQIDVRWKRTDNAGFELIWIEKGGPVVSQPVRRGFGSTLLESVTGRELGGSASLDYRSEGIRVTLTAGPGAIANGGLGPTNKGRGPSEARSPEDPAGGLSTGDGGDLDIRGIRVLIVEDAVLLALELEAGLTGSGAIVVGLASDLKEALAMVDLSFDVAVLDANLNGLSVEPVARALMVRGKPFIFATGYGEAGAAPVGFHAPVVRKPYNIRQIAGALVSALTA